MNNSLEGLSPATQINNRYGMPESMSQTKAMAADSRQVSITLTTDEGDKVTVSQASVSGMALSHTEAQGNGTRLMSFSMASMEYENMFLQVEGDLNDEELADISSLFNDLSSIAKDFFSGDMGSALEGATQLGDLGSIAELSAVFTRKTVVSSYMADYHPLPGSLAKESPIHELPPPADTEETLESVNEMMRAQWKQILDLLENHNTLNGQVKEESAPPAAATEPAAGRMLGRIMQTLEQHPRLSPFALPLADKAIEAQSAKVQDDPQRAHLPLFLRQNFMKEFDDWFM